MPRELAERGREGRLVDVGDVHLDDVGALAAGRVPGDDRDLGLLVGSGLPVQQRGVGDAQRPVRIDREAAAGRVGQAEGDEVAVGIGRGQLADDRSIDGRRARRRFGDAQRTAPDHGDRVGIVVDGADRHLDRDLGRRSIGVGDDQHERRPRHCSWPLAYRSGRRSPGRER
jgi:hypothetical protein